jgi:hypothetical protein
MAIRPPVSLSAVATHRVSPLPRPSQTLTRLIQMPRGEVCGRHGDLRPPSTGGAGSLPERALALQDANVSDVRDIRELRRLPVAP